MYLSLGFPHLQNRHTYLPCCGCLWQEARSSHLCHRQHRSAGILFAFPVVDLVALKASCPPARGLPAPGSFGLRIPGSSFLPASPCPPSLTGWFRSEAGADATRNEKLVPAPEESGSSWGPKTHLQETLKQQRHAALGSIVLSLSDEGRQLAESLKDGGMWTQPCPVPRMP